MRLIDHSLKVHAKVLKLSPLLSTDELLTQIADHNLNFVYKFRKLYVCCLLTLSAHARSEDYCSCPVCIRHAK